MTNNAMFLLNADPWKFSLGICVCALGMLKETSLEIVRPCSCVIMESCSMISAIV